MIIYSTGAMHTHSVAQVNTIPYRERTYIVHVGSRRNEALLIMIHSEKTQLEIDLKRDYPYNYI